VGQNTPSEPPITHLKTVTRGVLSIPSPPKYAVADALKRGLAGGSQNKIKKYEKSIDRAFAILVFSLMYRCAEPPWGYFMVYKYRLWISTLVEESV
jgi:hypothetical protein